ncbi:MAG: hypothetical protein ACRD0P_14470 [Stackebrandtia sp.]
MSAGRAADEAGGVVGVVCGGCLDFGDLPGLGPCPHCRPDRFLEHLACEEPNGPPRTGFKELAVHPETRT